MHPPALPHTQLLAALYSAALILIEAVSDPVAIEQASLRQRVSAINALTSLLCQLHKHAPQPVAAPRGDTRQPVPVSAAAPAAASPAPRQGWVGAPSVRATQPVSPALPSAPSPAPRRASEQPVAHRLSDSVDPHSHFLADYHTLTAAPSRLAALRLPRLHASALNRSSLTAARPAA